MILLLNMALLSSSVLFILQLIIYILFLLFILYIYIYIYIYGGAPFVHNKQMCRKSDGVQLFCLRAQGKHLAKTWRNYKKQRSYQKQSKKYIINAET